MSHHLLFPRGLYGITPEWDDTDRLLDALNDAAAGGMVALQWRRKQIGAGEGLEQARRVQARCRELGVLCIINDDWRLAAMIDADGVHIGRDDGSLAQARMALGSDKRVGVSCYDDLERARQALDGGASYVAFGSMFASQIKPDAVRAPLDLLGAARELAESLAHGQSRAAICAIGGITPENAAGVVAAGADSLAVISSLFEAPNIVHAAQQFKRLYL